MKGDHHLLALTSQVDEISGDVKPLFAFPVQVCKATGNGGDVRFENAAPSGAEYETCYRDTGTGELFEYGDRLRGVRVGDEFKSIAPEQIKEIEEATKVKTMYALGSIKLTDFWAKYGDRVNGRYFLQIPAKGGSATAYKLTYDAMLKEGTAIVTKRTPTSRQKLCVIYADKQNGCLMLVEVAFAAAIREPDEQVQAAQAVKVEGKRVQQAREVLKAMDNGAEALDAEVDEAVARRSDLIEKAVAGEALPAPEPVPAAAEEADLAAALEASLAATK